MQRYRLLVIAVYSVIAVVFSVGSALAAENRNTPSTPRIQIADRCIRYDAKWSYFPVEKTAAGSMCDTTTNFSIEPENICDKRVALGYCIREEDEKMACSYQALGPASSSASTGAQSVFCNPPSNANGGVVVRYKAYVLDGDAKHDKASQQALKPLLDLEHYEPVHPRASLPPFPIRVK